MKRVLIIAGEVSGDQHAARLVSDLKKVRTDVEWFGIGGEALRAEGVNTWVDLDQMAVVGFWEVLVRYPFFRRVFKQVTQRLKREKPDAVLLVDYPGFNLKVAEKAHELGIPVFYYISPQVWAWRPGRIPKMAQILNLLMVIFPFEVGVFKGTGLRTEFVGHPLVESVQRTLATPSAPLPWPDGKIYVALLPGSRRLEIKRVLPPMLAAAREIRRRHPDTVYLVAAANDEIAALIRAQIEALPAADQQSIAVVVGQVRDVVRQARAAMVCSGTATIETALLKCPMIVVYRTNPLTYLFGQHLVKVPWLGMVNLIANRQLCPEFIQSYAQPIAMANALEPLLENSFARTVQLSGFEEVAHKLTGTPRKNAGQLVAEALGD